MIPGSKFIISFLAANPVPIPRDLELPLPLDEYDLKIFLVILFLAHIFFVNLMVGGSVLGLLFEIIGLNFPRYDRLGKKIADTITVNKSLAVVLGVGPLLCINLAYTLYFYSANAITGYAWGSIIPLVSAAFLLSYLHKYTWNSWTGKKKNLHMMVGGISTLLFLSIPFIFLANINLMLFPEEWQHVTGFFSALAVGNVFPRYFHFLAATMALTGLFLAWWFGRKKFPVEEDLPGFTRTELRRLFYRVAFYVTAAQLVFGPLLLLTLPSTGISAALLWMVGAVILMALFILHVLHRKIKSDDSGLKRGFVWIGLLFAVIVLTMGTVRHIYRETCVNDHKALVADRTDQFRSIKVATQMRLEAGLSAGEAVGGGPTGKKVFVNCAACHAIDHVLAAPSLVEVYNLYKDNPGGIVKWAENPGKKRTQFTQMPSFAHLGEEKLQLVAQYIIDTVSERLNTGDASAE